MRSTPRLGERSDRIESVLAQIRQLTHEAPQPVAIVLTANKVRFLSRRATGERTQTVSAALVRSFFDVDDAIESTQRVAALVPAAKNDLRGRPGDELPVIRPRDRAVSHPPLDLS